MQTYSADYTRHFVAQATNFLRPLEGTPLRFLEVGVCEARSACWLLENVLTHPDSVYVGIDPWHRHSQREEQARKNLAHYPGKWELYKGRSWDVLPKLVLERFDAIHIDGEHTNLTALVDGCLAWPMLKGGGFLAFDDLTRDERPGSEPVVQRAFDIFCELHSDAKPLHRGRQGWVRKL